MRVGILGAGFMGQNHGERLKKINNAEIVAVCDESEELRITLGDKLGIPHAELFADFDAMLSANHLEALFVCLPPFAHTGQVEKAAAKGLHIFMEKPIALTIKRAKSMAKAINKSSVVSQVGYHLRQLPAVKALKQMIESGEAGKIASFIGTYQCNSLHSPWWRKKDLCGGQIFEQAIHLYDLASYLLGSPVTVSASMANLCHKKVDGYTIEDTSAAIINYQNGAIASITASNCAIPGRWDCFCRIICENCMVDDITGGQARIIMHKDGKVIGEKIVDNAGDPFFEEDRQFINAAAGKSEPQATVDEGLLDVKVVSAAVRSAENGAAPVAI